MAVWKTPIPANIADQYCLGNKFAGTILTILLTRARVQPGTVYRNGVPLLLEKGQCVCGREELTEYVGLSRKQSGKIQRILTFLEKSAKQITKRKTQNGSIITILYYQEITHFEQTNKQPVNNRQTNGEQPIDTNKIDKIDKIDKKKEKIPYQEIIDYLNKKSSSNYKHTTTITQEKIRARWKEGYRLDDFKKVIDNKLPWLDEEKTSEWFRPVTLFGRKFESYLNNKKSKKTVPQEGSAYSDHNGRTFLLHRGLAIYQEIGEEMLMKFAKKNNMSGEDIKIIKEKGRDG